MQLTADHDYFYNCGECVHSDGTTLENSYVITNGTPCQSGYSGSTCEGGDDHFEDIYCDTGSETVNHNTLLNPHGQTAVVFCNTNNGASEPCANRLSITNNLMAGGGFVLYSCSGRILAGQFDVDVHWQSHRSLRGDRDVPAVDWGSTCGSADQQGADGNGYWPYGGYYGVDDLTYCPGTAGVTWSGNVWDENSQAVNCST